MIDLDKAAGLAWSAGDAVVVVSWCFFVSLLLSWNALKFSFLIPSVAHIELLAASSGSSILRVLGIRIEFFGFLDLSSQSLDFIKDSSSERFSKIESVIVGVEGGKNGIQFQ